MIDRYQLRYFLAVVETGSFSRAAERVNVTQPTLSTGIAKLETTIGNKLFLRDSRRVSLTEEGNRFLAHARIIEGQFDLLERKTANRSEVHLFRLGVLRTIPTRFMELVLEQRREMEAPDCLELLDASERDLSSRLATGRLDAAVTLLREHSHFDQEPLFREGYGLAMPLWHPLAHKTEIEGHELANDVMMVRRSCEVLSETSRYFTNQGVRPHFSFRSLNDDKVMALVGAGMGITVMPNSYQHPTIVRAKLVGFCLEREVGIVFSPQGRMAQSGVNSLIHAIRAVVPAFLVGAELGANWPRGSPENLN